MFKALVYAYILGGLTFIPLVVAGVIFITVYTSVPVGDADVTKKRKGQLEAESLEEENDPVDGGAQENDASPLLELNDRPRTRKGWLTVRRTFEETEGDTSYVTLVRSFLDSRSKDPKRSRPKDMWYAVLKRNILYLYEDEDMSECDAAIELSGHDVLIYPEGLPDAELYAKRNAICLRRKVPLSPNLPSVTKEMKLEKEELEELEHSDLSNKQKEKEREILLEADKKAEEAREEAFNPETPWFIFVRANVEMEDWYFSLFHASSCPAQTPTLVPLRDVFDPNDMNHLVKTLDDQPDVIPMRWLNALLGRIFFSHYRTRNLEAYIIGRLMKKLEKVKRPQFLTDISVSEVSVGNRAPMLSKPMLKELTQEGDAAMEVHFQYKGEIRLTIEATAVINLGARFKSYTVKLVLAAVLKELEGNLLIKVKRPPSNRIWYAFTQTPRMVLEVEPIVSDRQITWGMILSTMESKLKEIVQESIVMPNMDDIAFFDSLPFPLQRGGIFADASRRHAKSDADVPTAEGEPPATASVPNLEAPSSPPPNITAAAQSDDALAVKVTSSSSSGDSNSKAALRDPTDSQRNNTRRKSWFSTMRSDDGSLSPDLVNDDDNRGRTGYSGNKSEGQPSRSRSPMNHRSANSVSSQISNKADQSSKAEAGASQQRSSSRLSNRGLNGSEAKEDMADGTNSKSHERRKSDASLRNRSPSPPSFFSTLKSRAGDKQALSNTAKEAMRKWGVNWGMKKETNAGSSSGDESTSSLKPSSPDPHKPRASYAEVRAAVAERKERERHAESEGDTSPQRGQTWLKPPSMLPTDSAQSDNASIVSSSTRLSTPRLTSKKSSPSISLVNTDIDAETSVPTEAPIRAQPQAKTMTIPGIHAKKRGEIQSMGYVAPQPTASSASTSSSTSLESKLKNPAIQSISRFWKNGALANRDKDDTIPQGVQSQSEPSSEPATATGGGASCDHSTSTATSEMSGGIGSGNRPNISSSEGLERLSPPPPPPRPIPIPVVATSETAVTPGFTSSSPASKALKDIVSRDESSRNAQESDEGSERESAPASTASSPEALPPVGALNSNASRGSIETTANLRLPPPLPPRRVPAVA